MKETIKVATVASVERLNNSGLNNPAWLINFEDGTSAMTKANVSFAYEVTYDNLLGKQYNVHLTAAGRIIDMQRAERLENSQESGMEFISNRWVFTGGN